MKVELEVEPVQKKKMGKKGGYLRGEVNVVCNKFMIGKSNKNDDWSDKDSNVELQLSDVEEEIVPVKKNKKNAKSKKKKDVSDEEDEEIVEEQMADEEINENKNVSPKVEDNLMPAEEKDEIVDKVAEIKIEEPEEEIKKEPEEKKLTHKEKKKLKKQQEYEKQMETLLKKGGQGHSDLDSNFTVSQSQKTAGQLAHLENAVDIKIENFGISAKGNDLFVNANLLIAQGRHYGLVGPNGSV